MISWRYHLVSIVAVFLALALGVLAGTAVVNQGLVPSLKDRTDALVREEQANRATIGEQSAYITNLLKYAAAARKAIVTQRLSAVDILLVADDGADPVAVDEVRTALSEAGARIVTTLVPLPKLTSTDPAEAKVLANLIGVPAQTDPAELPVLVAQTLAARLAQGPPSPIRPGQPDVLEALLAGGILDSREPGVKSAADLGIPAAVVVVGGTANASATPPGEFLVPLVRELSTQGMVVAAGETRAAPEGFISIVRADGVGVGPRVTVDDLESAMGGTALVIGLRRALDQGLSGDYGIATSQLLPPLP